MYMACVTINRKKIGNQGEKRYENTGKIISFTG